MIVFATRRGMRVARNKQYTQCGVPMIGEIRDARRFRWRGMICIPVTYDDSHAIRYPTAMTVRGYIHELYYIDKLHRGVASVRLSLRRVTMTTANTTYGCGA